MTSVSGYPPLPADGYAARWRTWDGGHHEDLSVHWDNEAWTAVGRVEREAVEYVVRLSPLWHTRQFLLFRDLPEPDLWLGTDGHGRWGEVNGAHRPELDGAVDVALAVTPFTLALPIRRFAADALDGTDADQQLVAPVLTIDVVTLAVARADVAYTRTGAHSWTVSVDGDDPIGFDVDQYGVPLDLPGRFRRV